jgi:hypothetical protein
MQSVILLTPAVLSDPQVISPLIFCGKTGETEDEPDPEPEPEPELEPAGSGMGFPPQTLLA